MKKTSTLLTISLAATLTTAVAAEVDLSKLPPPSTKTGVTYAKDIRPIFESSCFRCHGEEKQKENLRLDSLEAVLKGGKHGKAILPGNSKESPLVIAVARLDEKKAMPPRPKGPQGRGGPGGGPGGSQDGSGSRPPGSTGGQQRPGGPGGPGPMGKALTAEQVGLIRAWIDQGAK